MTRPVRVVTPMYEAPPAAADTSSYEAFWAEQLGEVQYETIRGVRVEVPRDMPLRLLRQIERQANADASLDVVQAMAAALFGADVIGRWVEAGMGMKEFQVVIRWGTEHAKGNPVTWKQAFDLVEEAGKAPPGRARSKSTGGRSRAASTPRTGSTRRASPA